MANDFQFWVMRVDESANGAQLSSLDEIKCQRGKVGSELA